MKSTQHPSTTVDPTQPAAPRAVFEDKSSVPATPQIALTPPRHGIAAAPAGSAAYSSQKASQQQQQPNGVRQRVSAAASMAKHASDAGLAGVAEAAGLLVGDLTPASKWRQELLQLRLVAGLTLAMLLGYTLFLAPRKLGFWGELALVLRGCSDNALSFALFNMLGVMPAILACVAWPVLRNKNHKAQPMRPYIMASFATGAFAFLSHIARWNPSKTAPPLPPARLSGSTAWLQRLSEGRLLPATLLASTLYFYIFPLIATPATWAHFGYLFTHSLTVHVMMIDFSLLTLMSPWLVIKDATARDWGLVRMPAGRWFLGLAMLAAPALGPAAYLIVRPVSAAGYNVKSLRKDIVSLLMLPGRWVRGDIRRQRRQQQQQRGQAGGVASSTTSAARPSEVETAAAVPLPSAPVLAASAAAGMLKGAWDRSWLWLGQRIARMRGGGAAVATSEEVDGDEHDIDGGDYGVAPDTTAHSAGTHAHTFVHALGDFWHRHHQQQHQLGPGPSPVKATVPTGGVELLFSDDYDEYDADTSESTDDGSDSVTDIISDKEDEDDDDDDLDFYLEDVTDKQEGGSYGVGPGVGAATGGTSHQPQGVRAPGTWYEVQLLQKEDDPEVQDQEDGGIFDDGQGVDGDVHAAVATNELAGRHGSRTAKELALARLAELGHQAHPRMVGATASAATAGGVHVAW